MIGELWRTITVKQKSWPTRRFLTVSKLLRNNMTNNLKESEHLYSQEMVDDLSGILSGSDDWNVKSNNPVATPNNDDVKTKMSKLTSSVISDKSLSVLASSEQDSDMMLIDMFGDKSDRKKLKGAAKVVTTRFTSVGQQFDPNLISALSSPSIVRSTQLAFRQTLSEKSIQQRREFSTTISKSLINEQSMIEKEIQSPKKLQFYPDTRIELEMGNNLNEQDQKLSRWLDDRIDHADEIDIPNNDTFWSLEELASKNKLENSSSQKQEILEGSTESNQQNVKYGNKFRLMTQQPNRALTQDPIGTLNLPKDTKIKVALRLSKEQEDVIKLAEQGKNIFYTGSAGTGKSILLREIIKTLKAKYGPEYVSVTASTGLAACNIGGITIHSFAGIGLGKSDELMLYKKVRRSRKHFKRWEKIKVLIVDEISMLHGELLDKLNYIAQKIRKNKLPFGGIQLIFCGDFFQLPPVTRDNSACKFAFESELWNNGINVTIMLQKVFRQQSDTQFVKMLNKMRIGEIDDETEQEFKKLSRPLEIDEIIPAELYSTRVEVDKANNSRLSKLPGNMVTYHSIDGGSLEDDEMKEKLLQNFLAPKQLNLKVGAQVMMIKNVDATLVNGSLGKVIDFIDYNTYMFYDTIMKNPYLPIEDLEKLKLNPEKLKQLFDDNEDEEKHGTAKLKLAKEAFAKHSEDFNVTELGENIFDFLAGKSGDNSEIVENLERKRKMLRELHESSVNNRKLPLVRFKTSDMTTRTILVEPEDWCVEDENEKPLVSRVQLPLMLAWSLSIHKSQGQTLPKVKVDLKKVFEKGQAYVALSRAVSRSGLQVLNFDRNKVSAHVKVVNFYKTLSTANDAMKHLKVEKENTPPGNMLYDSNDNQDNKFRTLPQKKRTGTTTGISDLIKNCKRRKFAESDSNLN